MSSPRKHFRSLAITGALTAGLLSVPISPASAATTYNDGVGQFEAVAYVSPPCSTYQVYNAELVFPDGAVATVSSGLRPAWHEFPDGTHLQSDCEDAVTAIDGFTGTLTTTSGVCTLSGGTYQRGAMGTSKPELNVKYEFGVVAGSCGATANVVIKATIPSVDLPQPVVVGPFEFDYASACDAPIAPQSCTLGPQQGSW